MITLPKWVLQTSLKPLAWDIAFGHCPYCHSDKIRYSGSQYTLLGGGDGTREGDPNHWWTSGHCNECGKSFIEETKSGEVWFTDAEIRGKLIAGIARCFEDYMYPCQCGGLITRQYTKLDGTTPVAYLSSSVDENKKWVRHYRTFYSCDACGFRDEPDDDYSRV